MGFRLEMAKPFEATLNILIDDHSVDWGYYLASRISLPLGPVCPLDTDLSATLQPDRLVRVDATPPFVLHLELESSCRLGIPSELLRDNTYTDHQTQLPVHSVEVLMRMNSNASDQTGVFTIWGANGKCVSLI